MEPQETLNPVSEYMEKRSDELVRNASMEAFHRLRVVERLFLEEDVMNPAIADSQKDLEDWTKHIMGNENDRKLKWMQDTKVTTPLAQMTKEPFDMSDEVIADGVKWYRQLKTSISYDDTSLLQNFEGLTLNLFQIAKSADKLPVVIDPSTKNFSQLVNDLAAFKYRALASQDGFLKSDSGQLRSEDDMKAMSAISGHSRKDRIDSEKFENGIKSLASEFDRIYSAQLNKPSEV